MLQQNLDASDCTNRLLHSFRHHASPIQSVDQHRELRCGQINSTVTDRRPSELPLLQPLRHEHHTAAVPCQKFDSVPSLRAENKYVAAIGIRLKRFTDQRRQGVNRLPEVYTPCLRWSVKRLRRIPIAATY